MRLIHHLIATSLSAPEPIACAERYDDAAAFVREEMGPLAIISLYITRREIDETGRAILAPCPVCADAAEFWKHKPKPIVNGAAR